jgi:hypothetical protein
MAQRPEAPAVAIALPGTTLRIRDGALGTVIGDPADVLAWLTGRGDGRRLRIDPPGPLPPVPPLS